MHLLQADGQHGAAPGAQPFDRNYASTGDGDQIDHGRVDIVARFPIGNGAALDPEQHRQLNLRQAGVPSCPPYSRSNFQCEVLKAKPGNLTVTKYGVNWSVHDVAQCFMARKFLIRQSDDTDLDMRRASR